MIDYNYDIRYIIIFQVLRSLIPPHLGVMEALDFPPGMQAFLTNNLSWLLRPNEVSMDVRLPTSRKRGRAAAVAAVTSEDEESNDEESAPAQKQRRGLWARLEESDLSSDDDDSDDTPAEIQTL